LSTFSQVPAPDQIQDKGKSKATDTWQDDDQNPASPIQRLKFEEPEFWHSRPVPATQAPFAIEPDVFGASSLPKTPMKNRYEAIPSMEITELVDQADEVSLNDAVPPGLLMSVL
jgi:hypothetical protein